MKIDVAQVIGAVTRTVERQDRDGRPARVVIATRSYDAEVAEVWDAMTNANVFPDGSCRSRAICALADAISYTAMPAAKSPAANHRTCLRSPGNLAAKSVGSPSG